MNLKKAAQGLVECGYAEQVGRDPNHPNIPTVVTKDYKRVQIVDPINNEAQRQALLEWFKVNLGEIITNNPDRKWRAMAVIDRATSDRHLAIADAKTRLEAENACLEEILK